MIQTKNVIQEKYAINQITTNLNKIYHTPLLIRVIPIVEFPPGQYNKPTVSPAIIPDDSITTTTILDKTMGSAVLAENISFEFPLYIYDNDYSANAGYYVLNVSKAREMIDNVFVNLNIEDITGNASNILGQNITTINGDIGRIRQLLWPIETAGWVNTTNILDYSVTGPKMTSQLVLPAGVSIVSSFTGTRPTTTNYVSQALVDLRGTANPFYLNTLRLLAEAVNGTPTDFSVYVSKTDFAGQVAGLPAISFAVSDRLGDLMVLANSLDGTANSRFASVVQNLTSVMWRFDYILNAENIARSVIDPRFSNVETGYAYLETKRLQLRNEVYSAGWVGSTRLSETLNLPINTTLPTSITNLADRSDKITTTEDVKNILLRDIYGSIDNIRTIQSLAAIVNSDASYAYNITNNIAILNQQVADASGKIGVLVSPDLKTTNVETTTNKINTQGEAIRNIRAIAQNLTANTDLSMAWIQSQTAIQSIEQYRLQSGLTLYEIVDKLNLYAIPQIEVKMDTSYSILNSRIDSSGLEQSSISITGLLDSEVGRLSLKSDTSLAVLYSRETNNLSSLAGVYSIASQIPDTSMAIHDASLSVESVRPFSADGSVNLVENELGDVILGIGAELERYQTNLVNIGIRERNVVELCDISLAGIQFPSLDVFETRWPQLIENYELQYGNVRIISDNSLYWFSLYVDAYDSYFKSRHIVADNSLVSLDTHIRQSLTEKIRDTDTLVEPSFNDLDMAITVAREKIDGSLNASFQRDKDILENSVWRHDYDVLDLSLNSLISLGQIQDNSINAVLNRQWTTIAATLLPNDTQISSVAADVSSEEVVSTSWIDIELKKTVGILATSLNSLVKLANAVNSPIQTSSIGALLGDVSANLLTQEARLNGLNSSGLGTFNVDASLAYLQSAYSALDTSANRCDSSLNHFILKTDGSLATIPDLLVWPQSWVSSFDSSFVRIIGKPVPSLAGFDPSYSSLFERNATQTTDLIGLYGDVASIFPSGYFDRFDLTGVPAVPSTLELKTRVDASISLITNTLAALDNSLSLVNSGVRSYLTEEIVVSVADYSGWIETTGQSLEVLRTNTGPWNNTDSSLVILSGIASQVAGSLTGTGEKYTDVSNVATTNLSALNDLSQNAWIQTMNSSVVLPVDTSVISGNAAAHPQSTGYVKTTIAGLISDAPTALNTLNKLADALGGDPNTVNTIQNRLQLLDTSLAAVDYRSSIETLDASFTQALPAEYTTIVGLTTTAIERMRVNDVSTNLVGTSITNTNTTYNTSSSLSLNTSGKIGTVNEKITNADASLGRIYNLFSTIDNSYVAIDGSLTGVETLSLALVPKIQANDISTNLLVAQTSQKETDIYNLFQLFTKIYGVTGTPNVNSIVVSFQPPLIASAVNVLLYKIYVSGGGNNYVVDVSNTATSYEVVGLSQDTNYSIYVEAVTEYITTSSSTIIVKTLMGGVSNLRATANTTTSITVAYDTNASATSYNWTAIPDLSGVSTRSGSVSAGTTTVPITDLTSGAVYTISIVANGANGSSLPTTIVYGTLLVAPSITGTDNTTTSIQVSVAGPTVGTVSKYTWSATATGYTTQTGEFAAGTTLAALTGLVSGVVYSISVVAVGLYGVSAGTATYGTRLLAPTGLTATGNTTTTIAISFTGPSVGTITKYTWTAVPDIAVATLTGDLSGNTTTKTITGMTSGAIYTISVVAVGLYGTSAVSNSLVYGTVLPAPSGVSATSTTNSITLNWAMAADVSQNVAKYSYTVYQSSTLAASGDVSSNIFTAVASGLTGATSYTAGVYAVNTYGNSATSSLAVNTIAEAPTNLVATSNTSTSITVSFTRPSGTFARFDWRARPTAGGTTLTGNFTTAGSSGTISGLSPGVEYGLSLAAIGTFSSGYSSELISGTTLDAPTGLTFTARDVSSITFGWNAVSGATSYNVGAESITLGTIVTKTAATNSVVMDGLATGRIYDLSVAAVTPYATGPRSSNLRNSTAIVLPESLTVSSITPVQATVSFTALATQDCSYVLRTVPNTTQYILTAGTTTRDLTGLASSTPYTVFLDASNTYISPAINRSATFSTPGIINTNVYRVSKAAGVDNTSTTVSSSDSNIGTSSMDVAYYLLCSPTMDRIVINGVADAPIRISSNKGKTFTIASYSINSGSLFLIGSESTQYIYSKGLNDNGWQYYRSTNYGTSFTLTSITVSSVNIHMASTTRRPMHCSRDGSKVVFYRNNSAEVYMSNNYGVNFTLIKTLDSSIGNSGCITISNNSKYIVITVGKRIVIGYNENGINIDATNISQTSWTDKTFSAALTNFSMDIDVTDNGMIFVPGLTSNTVINYITYVNFINATALSAWSSTTRPGGTWQYIFAGGNSQIRVSSDGNTIIIIQPPFSTTTSTIIYTSADRGSTWNTFNLTSVGSTHRLQNMYVNLNFDRALYVTGFAYLYHSKA